jgi:hypothetical protein
MTKQQPKDHVATLAIIIDKFKAMGFEEGRAQGYEECARLIRKTKNVDEAIMKILTTKSENQKQAKDKTEIPPVSSYNSGISTFGSGLS